MHVPELVLFDGRVEDLVADLVTAGRTLFVVDPFNAPAVARQADVVVVEDIAHDGLPTAEAIGPVDRVVAVGGCSALDAGRYYAGGQDLVIVPTILSTSCISSHISVVRRQGDKRSVVTTVPRQTIVPLRTILATPPDDLVKWSASGFGDLFANLSAATCQAVVRDHLSWQVFADDAAEALSALDWVEAGFDGYDERAVRQLATHLHRASVDVVRRGHNALSADFEHWLYETMIQRYPYRHDVQTHGILVAMGSLLVLRVFEDVPGAWQVSGRLREACRRVGLPVTYSALAAIGISRTQIAESVAALDHLDHFVTRYTRTHGLQALDEIFGDE